MNKNVLIVLAGGFVVAILVAVLVQASLGGKNQPAAEGPRSYVLVAAKNLPLGKELAEGDLRWQPWPEETAFTGAIVRQGEQKSYEALTGRLVQRVNEGQPVMQSYVFRKGRGNVVAATLEQGQRAMAIPVKASAMAGGFIAPGDFVDIILTYKVSVDRSERSSEISSFLRSQASETILKNIRIMAVDQEASRAEGSSDAKIAKTVTLAVNPKQAERLALASDMGDLTLVLRGIGDEDDTQDESVTTDVDVSRAMQNIIDMTENDNARPVRVYSGADVTEHSPRGSGGVKNINVINKNNRASTISSSASAEEGDPDAVLESAGEDTE